MDHSESSSHSFIIRIWREEDRRPAWRGHVTHVPSGNRRHFKDLDELTNFMLPYLVEMGVSLGFRRRIKQRLCRWRCALKPGSRS